MFRILAALKVIVLSFLASLVLIYIGDYLFVRFRMTRNLSGDPFETRMVERAYGLPHKNGSAEIVTDPPEAETCVHSIFPHMGYEPCWYLNRNSKNIIMLELLVTHPEVLENFAFAPDS
jgi:hypothetical protein